MSDNYFQSINPATEEVVWEGAESSEETVNQAVLQAAEAGKLWSSLPPAERIATLDRYASCLKEERGAIAEAISQEVGKPLWDAATEVDAMIAKIQISKEAYNERCKEKKRGGLAIYHRPLGVVAILAPFNFPGHLPNGQLVPALLAGNSAVLKPSDKSPRMGEWIAHLFEKAGLPKGVLQLVQGGATVARQLASHPFVRAIFFTGSWKVGKHLSEQFGSHPEKLLVLEMGGNNPLVIWGVDDVKAAALLALQSAFLTAGQRCTNARRLILPADGRGDRLLEELEGLINGVRIGPYTDRPEPFLGPLISKEAVSALFEAEESLKRAGGIVITPLKRVGSQGFFVTPGLIDTTPISDPPDRELFGPLLQVRRVSHFSSAIEEANRTEYGLVAGLISNCHQEWERFSSEVRAGVINWNAPLTGLTGYAPFGGVGKSGNFRPAGYNTIDFCCYPVASFQNTKPVLPKQPLPGVGL